MTSGSGTHEAILEVAHWNTGRVQGRTRNQKRVRKLLREKGTPMAAMDINAALKKEYDATAKLLQRMVKDGILNKAGYGQYYLPEHAMANLSNCPSDVSP